MKKEFYVYYYLDVNKNTLYVGKTNNMFTRNNDHQRYKEWYGEVNEIFHYIFSDETTQRMVELFLINELKAIHNEVYNYGDTPSIKIELPESKLYDSAAYLNSKISKNNKPPKIKINHLDDAINLNREIRFEDIMYGNKKILFSESRYIQYKFGNYNTKIDYDENELKSFYLESDKFEDEKNFYIVLKDKKQIEVFKDSYLHLDFGGKSGGCGGLGLLHSSYNQKKETLTFHFGKEVLENYVAEYIPNVSEFFSNLMKCEKKELAFN
jgi:predicted GIY-YIG superfamily endonuclease